MDYGDYYWGLYRDYYKDLFPHSRLSTRQENSKPHSLDPDPREDPKTRSLHGGFL